MHFPSQAGSENWVSLISEHIVLINLNNPKSGKKCKIFVRGCSEHKNL
jgi:hypothetical protein